MTEKRPDFGIRSVVVSVRMASCDLVELKRAALIRRTHYSTMMRKAALREAREINAAAAQATSKPPAAP